MSPAPNRLPSFGESTGDRVAGTHGSRPSFPWASARLYHTLRTAHLERAAELPPAPILYGVRRYDFDPALAEQVGAARAGALRAAWTLGRSGVQVLEINEPAAMETVGRTAVALLWLRVRQFLGQGVRPQVVTYAIANSNPFAVPPGLRFHRRLKRRVEHVLARYVWWECDRVAYGTHAAVEIYRTGFRTPRRFQASTLVPALPAPCPCVNGARKHQGRVAFLGAFNPRKGFPLVLAAWAQMRLTRPDTRLVVMGKGSMEGLACEAALRDPLIRVIVDPPRSVIHEELAAAEVLVLPSQPSASWREQVGLPIVEALAHGCVVVTTDETGLAEWLRAHGHTVVPGSADADRLAKAITEALVQPDMHAVLRHLPRVDGRMAADAWMFGEATTE